MIADALATDGKLLAHSPQNPSRRCVSDIMFLLLLPAAAGALMTPQPAKAAFKHGPCRVLVRNIAWEADEQALVDKLAAAFGPVAGISLAKASKRHHARPHQGWAYVSFEGESYARDAASAPGAVSLHGRTLSIRLVDTHEPQRRRARRRAEPELAPPAESRAALLEQLRSTGDQAELDGLMDALGDLRNAGEYRAAKAAWERVVVARIHKQGNGGIDVDVIDGDDYRRAGFSI